eukprot:TRINITY_DN11417_c0_g1_i4.p2 TRINITY_DN11417_c0_g1~~TRINITY_DN11417_c0_g1_i4.p2  ORF type:complete len:425 (-),score=78.75 TRINITY_DN11417_c0_g1_i4:2926-4173(-)
MARVNNNPDVFAQVVNERHLRKRAEEDVVKLLLYQTRRNTVASQHERECIQISASLTELVHQGTEEQNRRRVVQNQFEHERMLREAAERVADSFESQRSDLEHEVRNRELFLQEVVLTGKRAVKQHTEATALATEDLHRENARKRAAEVSLHNMGQQMKKIDEVLHHDTEICRQCAHRLQELQIRETVVQQRLFETQRGHKESTGIIQQMEKQLALEQQKRYECETQLAGLVDQHNRNSKEITAANAFFLQESHRLGATNEHLNQIELVITAERDAQLEVNERLPEIKGRAEAGWRVRLVRERELQDTEKILVTELTRRIYAEDKVKELEAILSAKEEQATAAETRLRQKELELRNVELERVAAQRRTLLHQTVTAKPSRMSSPVPANSAETKNTPGEVNSTVSYKRYLRVAQAL